MTWKTTNSQRYLCCSNSCVDKIRTKTHALEFSPKFSPMFALSRKDYFISPSGGGRLHPSNFGSGRSKLKWGRGGGCASVGENLGKTTPFIT